MELQALLVLCGLGVAGAAVLLLMGLFSVSGTSYEEAIAQQRQATTELLALADNRNKNKKNNKKAIKKQAKKEKVKDNAAVTTTSEPESEAPAENSSNEDSVSTKPHVEFCPPVIVDVPRDTPPNIKIGKHSKDSKVKPILINKEDPSCVNELTPSPRPTGQPNHFAEILPKDEFELLKSVSVDKKSEKKEEPLEKKEFKTSKQSKNNKTSAKPSPSTEAIKEQPRRELQNNDDAPKEQRKAKKSEKKIMEQVNELPQSDGTAQIASQSTEIINEKVQKKTSSTFSAPAASSPTGKNKKKKNEPNILSLMAGDGGGVNVSELVQIVRDAVLSRTEIQILTDALLNKHHEHLPEHSEWTEGPNDPIQKLKKQLADKEKALADEMEASQALHAKLKELRAMVNAERARATEKARAAEASAAELQAMQARLQRLMDDNHALAQEKHHLQSKLSAEGDAQAQRVQMEIHIQRLSESEAALLQQLSGLQAELSGRLVECTQARCEAAAARDSLLLAQQHGVELAHQLQEANRAYAEMEQQLQRSVHAEQITKQELRQAQERLNTIGELQSEIQRLKSRAQNAESLSEKLKEELEKQKQQDANEITSLKQQVSELESEISEIKQLTVTSAQNGLPTVNASDQHKTLELAKVESVVESLRSELTAAQRCSREQSEQLTRLQEQLHQYQDKNNELRTKNWKVMEALQSAEKALQAKSSSALPATNSETLDNIQEAHYNEVAKILQAACPSAAPKSTPGLEWLNTFASNLKHQLEKASCSTVTIPTSDDRLTELSTENEHLQSLVDKYKRIIQDTEGVLSLLQQNVTTEEQWWSQQLAEKQRELDELRNHTVSQMQKKIDSLQQELAKAQIANHSHSFADKERSTEEKLISDLKDKFKMDVSNGPFQVGVEEK